MSKVTELLSALLNDEQIEDFTPTSRMESYLKNCCLASGSEGLPNPISRADALLYSLAEKIAGGGSGGGGSASTEWFNDGNTHLWISLSEGRTSPILGVCVNGTATVDWGDGTTPDVLTGYFTTGNAVWTPVHDYAKPGDYVITVTVDGTMGIVGDVLSDTGTRFLRHSSGADVRNYAYMSAIKRVEVGKNVVDIGTRGFYNCYGLSAVKIQSEQVGIGYYSFAYCYAMQTLILPDGVTFTNGNTFDSCKSLPSMVIPASVTKLDGYTFARCSGLKFLDFTKHTSVPTLSSAYAFDYTPDDLEILVPAALHDEWIAATNWSAQASKIKAV